MLHKYNIFCYCATFGTPNIYLIYKYVRLISKKSKPYITFPTHNIFGF